MVVMVMMMVVMAVDNHHLGAGESGAEQTGAHQQYSNDFLHHGVPVSRGRNLSAGGS
jgi:hypothetical protein